MCTKFIFKNVTILANLGVRQGFTISPVFILYVDKMIKIVKGLFQDDCFLGLVYILMLMDDTIPLSLSRSGLIRIIQRSKNFGMSINKKKTTFMVINNVESDKEDIKHGTIKVEYCTPYIYLGASITGSRTYISVINKHISGKMKHVIKFFTFLNRNAEVPFHLKKIIADACILSTVLYGCAKWLTGNFDNWKQCITKL